MRDRRPSRLKLLEKIKSNLDELKKMSVSYGSRYNQIKKDYMDLKNKNLEDCSDSALYIVMKESTFKVDYYSHMIFMQSSRQPGV